MKKKTLITSFLWLLSCQVEQASQNKRVIDNYTPIRTQAYIYSNLHKIFNLIEPIRSDSLRFFF